MKIKDQFLLDPDLIFLNHGSFGACPVPVFETYQAWQRRLEHQPVAFLDQERDFLGYMKQVRIRLAEDLGADPDDLVGVTNATSGLNIVAQSLPLKDGDEILTTDHEYAALEKTWKFVAQRTGAKIVVAEIPLPLQSGAEFTAALERRITQKTRVLFLSHVTSPTALVFPIKDILKIARERGITSVVDGAHAPGLIDLNLTQLGADYYSGNCHKWMMAPKGSAFLWARRDLQSQLEPATVSHGWVRQGPDGQTSGAFGNSRFIDSMEVQGTRDPSAWLTVPRAIEFLRRDSWANITRQSAGLALETAHRIVLLTGLDLLADPKFIAPQMISVRLPDCDVHSVKQTLLDQYRIEVPVLRWKGVAVLRLSIQGYNTAADADALVDALREIFDL